MRADFGASRKVADYERRRGPGRQASRRRPAESGRGSRAVLERLAKRKEVPSWRTRRRSSRRSSCSVRSPIPQLVAAVDAAADFRILPDACVIKIGGQSNHRSRVAPRSTRWSTRLSLPARSTQAPDRDRSRHKGAASPTRSRPGCVCRPACSRNSAPRVADQNAAMLGQLLAKHGICAGQRRWALGGAALTLPEVNAVYLQRHAAL